MKSADLVDQLRTIGRMAEEEFGEFDREFGRAKEVLEYLAIPVFEILNAYVDQTRAIRSLGQSRPKDATLWAERSNKHIKLATHDSLLYLLKFYAAFSDYLLKQHAVSTARNYRSLKRKVEILNRRRHNISKPASKMRTRLKLVRQDIVAIDRTNTRLLSAITSYEKLIALLSDKFEAPDAVHGMKRQFALGWPTA